MSMQARRRSSAPWLALLLQSAMTCCPKNRPGGGQSEKDCREPHRIGGVARAASVGCVVREPRVIRISPTESIEPPVPSRGRARYVLQVVPGRERAVAERVKALAGPELVRDCFALSYCILKKNQGVWRLLTETMFPGYLFVASDDI